MSLDNTSRPDRPGPDELVPSRYALRVGEIDVLVVSDGVLSLPGAMLGRFCQYGLASRYSVRFLPAAIAAKNSRCSVRCKILVISALRRHRRSRPNCDRNFEPIDLGRRRKRNCLAPPRAFARRPAPLARRPNRLVLPASAEACRLRAAGCRPWRGAGHET
jgi:hypothetical protein